MEVVVGAGGVIKGLEEALVGMTLGEEKKVTIPAEKGYKNPAHPLYGKTLEFEIKVVEIFKSYHTALLEYYRA
jgi:FKBP-type peptidyl-prolyl cis-trans isomerase 2